MSEGELKKRIPDSWAKYFMIEAIDEAAKEIYDAMGDFHETFPLIDTLPQLQYKYTELVKKLALISITTHKWFGEQK